MFASPRSLAPLALALCAASTTGVPAQLPPSAPPVLVEREAYLMGTRLRARVVAPSAEAGVQAIEAAFGEVRRLEELLSDWREDSELSRLNRAAPGLPTAVSAELFRLLAETKAWAATSEGAFEPAVGALIDAWDLRGAGRRPDPRELARARSLSDAGAFALEHEAQTVTRRSEGSWMTTGGFGKGAALRAARRALGDTGVESGVLDFGGQVLVVGEPEAQAGWRIGVAHPRRRLEPAAWIRLVDRSAATSAASERFVDVDGERLGHIIDPRTGRPVPAWGSVTVVADDPLVADLASTTLFVLGPEAGMAWAESRPELGVLFLRDTGDRVEATWNAAMRPWLIEEATE